MGGDLAPDRSVARTRVARGYAEKRTRTSTPLRGLESPPIPPVYDRPLRLWRPLKTHRSCVGWDSGRYSIEAARLFTGARVIHSGTRGDYYWLTSHSNTDHISQMLASCPHVTRDKFVAITSFDSGPLSPSQDELLAGWSSDGRIMYSPRITESVRIPHEQYDEWLIFSHETRHLPEQEVFINWGGFTFADEDHHREQRERLWAQLTQVSAESYLAEGDYVLFASRNRAVFDCVTKAVRRLHAT